MSAEPPNEEAPGSGWLKPVVREVDCGRSELAGGTRADGVSAEPPNDDAPGTGGVVPGGDVTVAGGVTALGGTTTVPAGDACEARAPGAACAAGAACADEPVEADAAPARRSSGAPSWITHLRGSESRRLQ